LPEAVRLMVRFQTPNGSLPDRDVDDIVAFLKSLTGDQPKTSVPVLPPVAGTSVRPVD